jgi:hypothetical protein
MNRITTYAAGPELAWFLMFLFTVGLVSRNQPPTEAGNLQLEQIGWFLPFVGVLLSFVPLAWALGSPWWWLARIVVAGGIGALVVSSHLCSGIDYNDSRNSGVGTAFIMLVMLGYITLFVGTCITALFLLTKWRFLPFLKWTLIVFGVLAACWGIIVWLASMADKTKS